MMIKRIGIIYNREKKKAAKAAERVTGLFRRLGVAVLDNSGLNRSQLVVALGGDGMLLRAARLIKPGIPVLPVSLGSLNFLSGASISRLKSSCKAVIRGQFTTEKRLMLSAEAGERRFRALNDFVVERGTHRAVVLRVRINDELFASYLCDGLILSTPTGSTAYSLAAGGPVASPDLNGFILTPIAPHTLAGRTFVLSGNETVSVIPESECFLTVDGQEKIPVPARMCITVRRSPYSFVLARLGSEGFYRTVNSRLGRILSGRK